jgi:hypothetical protein
LLFNPQISPQRNRLRPDEIGFAFHWAGISQGRQITQIVIKCAAEIVKSAGFKSPQVAVLELNFSFIDTPWLAAEKLISKMKDTVLGT